MDKLSFKRVKKLTGDMVKAFENGDIALGHAKRTEAERAGKGRVFISHTEAIEWITSSVSEYNDRPHRALKKVRGDDGRLRHQTPREALIEHICNGWEPYEVDDDTLIDIFRPHRTVTVTRETVCPYGGMRYRNAEVLGHWNGQKVIVAYDIHDSRRVTVKTLQGEFICTAEFVAATGYRAQTAYEAAEEKRAKAQIKRKENQINQINDERMGGRTIEVINDGLVSAIDIIDVQPAIPIREGTYEETVMMLYGSTEDSMEGEEPTEEAAGR